MKDGGPAIDKTLLDYFAASLAYEHAEAMLAEKARRKEMGDD